MISRVVIHHLLHDKQYAKQVLPHLIPDYFMDRTERAIFKAYDDYVLKYHAFPTVEAIAVSVGDKDSGLSDEDFQTAQEFLRSDAPDPGALEWLVDQTEKFCRDTAVSNAVLNAGLILSGEDKKGDIGSIPGLLQSALAITFDSSIGHDYLEDAQARLDYYHEKSERLPFDLYFLNLVTRGGIPKKSLSVFMAGTGVGKTLLMCHLAAANLTLGKNVLYITLELSEEMISERIDANLLGVPVEDLNKLPRDVFLKKVEHVKSKTAGKLIIKEFPMHTVGAGHFRHLLGELKTKKGFVPDVVYIDYINLVLPGRAKMMGNSMNSYSYVKMAAEEVRALATEMDLRIVTATQTNRTGFENSEPSLTDTAESFGLPQTADFYCSLYRNSELEQLGQVMVTQLKNRWRDYTRNQKFVLGLDKPYMRFYDAETKASMDLQNSGNDVPIVAPKKQTGFAGFK